MTPGEVWWFIEAVKPKRMYGDLTEADAAELYEELSQWELQR